MSKSGENARVKYRRICKKTWEELTGDDLSFLYLELDLKKAEIADLFNVSKGKVDYRLKKMHINKNDKIIADALLKTIKTEKNETLKQLIFGDECIIDSQSDNLVYGDVIITKGVHKGRIGYYDDEDGKYGYVYFGSIVDAIDSCYRIPLSYMSNSITTYALYSRAEKLRSILSRTRALRQFGNISVEEEEDTVELYGEYVLILQLLNKVYVETNFLHSEGNTRVFLSHSSVDAGYAHTIASDLKIAGYDVWLDKWELELGHSIPQSITEGLDAADALIVLLSKDYLKSVFCRDEWQGYYMKYKAADSRIITIIIDDSEPPTILASRKYYRIKDNYDYDNMLTELKRSLSGLGAQ